jgi:cytoskeletal protein CcmA (bactofilin family)
MCFDRDFHSEKGYALAVVLIVLVLLSSIVGFLMMGIVTQNRLIQKDINTMKARYYAEAGIYQFLSDPDLWRDIGRTDFEFTTVDSQKVQVNRTWYGGYWLITSVAEAGGRKKKIQVMAGQRGGEIFDRAIVLGDIRTPMTLTGSSVVHGHVHTGPEGMQYRPFRGERFSGSFTGDLIVADSSSMPIFTTGLPDREIERNKLLIAVPPADSYILDKSSTNIASFSPLRDHSIFFREGDLELNASHTVSLPDSIIWIATGNLTIAGELDSGNFARFAAGDTLTIHASLKGEHNLFYGGRGVRIDGETNVSGQVFSEGEIIISGNSHLKYPSLLYINPGLDGSVKTGAITLQDNATIEGVVMLPDTEEGIVTDEQTLISIGEQATLRGAVYNTSRTELNGKVSGTVMTNQFYFYISPTMYVNWLKDAHIDAPSRPSPFAVPIGFSGDKQFEILYWRETDGGTQE